MLAGARSLNLSNAVAVAVYEAWRQSGWTGAGDDRRAETGQLLSMIRIDRSTPS
jgi:tRNA C32,U32 (ribose-2'-O)-methylase TrmJ